MVDGIVDGMVDEKDKQELFAMADQFIDLANRLASEKGQELDRVGAAIRYAAARFNAHEASLQAEDLVADKENALTWFTDQYQKMLDDNLDQHIEIQRARTTQTG